MTPDFNIKLNKLQSLISVYISTNLLSLNKLAFVHIVKFYLIDRY